MTIKAWALDGTYGAADARLLLTGLPLAGATAARPLGVRSGVRPGTPASTVTTSATTWTVAPHAGVIDAQTSTTAGAYGYAVTAAETGNLQAAHATYSRVDLLSVQITDTSQGNSGTNGARVVYTAGTPASSPVAPATPARSLALAQITVPPSGSPTVAWVAPRLAAAGGIVAVASASDRATLSGVGIVVRADATAGSRIEATEDGSAWRTVVTADADASATLSLTAGWEAVEALTVTREAGWARLSGVIKRTSGALATPGAIVAGFRPSAKLRLPLVAVNAGQTVGPPAWLEIATNGDMTVLVASGGADWNTGTWFYMPTIPWRVAA